MPTIEEDIEQLSNSRSPKRRAAAKRLRKRQDVAAGPALLAALRSEVRDSRTWETQYQMIMALGECQFTDAVGFLEDLSKREFEATMVYLALGDAIVRLRIQGPEDGAPIIKLMHSRNDMIIDGAFRAMAMVKMTPSNGEIEEMVAFASKLPTDHQNHFWLLAAAPGWGGELVAAYVARCQRSRRKDIRECAELAAQGRYRKWYPL